MLLKFFFFHMSKCGTYTFSFYVFGLAKCIFCFSFFRQRTDNKTNCFFKNQICRSIFNCSSLFRIFFLQSLTCNQLSHETYIDYQTTQTGSRITVTSEMELFVNIFDTFHFLIIVIKSPILDGDRHFCLAQLDLNQFEANFGSIQKSVNQF